MATAEETLDRTSFMTIAGVCQGALVVIAFVGGWLLSIAPLQQFYFDWWSLTVGLLSTLPMLLLFGFLYWIDIPPIRRIREILTEVMTPLLADCRWYDLILLALMAGFCEEILFRGFMQIWLSQWGLPIAIVLTSLVFGLVHCVTFTYLIVASLVGAYLSGIMFLVDEPNLLVPITTHATYDYIAFLVLVAEYRRLPQPPVVGEVVEASHTVTEPEITELESPETG